eukprot:TRINITY_DN7453_c0_g1_i2.p1 TRINITY_DN7453_c0_g1~~TRINITY_DN7453_c0_g1_i2.p1  ORF type:complete len:773 (+),score=173.61 TRINITY_DN7453_c0_g1_i2:109-2427(+)
MLLSVAVPRERQASVVEALIHEQIGPASRVRSILQRGGRALQRAAAELDPQRAALRRHQHAHIALILAAAHPREVATATDAVRDMMLLHCGGRLQRILWAWRRLRRAGTVILRCLQRCVAARRHFIQSGVAMWREAERADRDARALRPLPDAELRKQCVRLAHKQGAPRSAILQRRKGYREVRSWAGLPPCSDATKLRVVTLLWERRRGITATTAADDDLLQILPDHICSHPAGPPPCDPPPSGGGRRRDGQDAARAQHSPGRRRGSSSPRRGGSPQSPRSTAQQRPPAHSAVRRALTLPAVPVYARDAVRAALFAAGTSPSAYLACPAPRLVFVAAHAAATQALMEAVCGDSAPRWSAGEWAILQAVCWPPQEEGAPTPAAACLAGAALPDPLTPEEVRELALIDWTERERRGRKRRAAETQSAAALHTVAEFRRSAEPHLHQRAVVAFGAGAQEDAPEKEPHLQRGRRGEPPDDGAPPPAPRPSSALPALTPAAQRRREQLQQAQGRRQPPRSAGSTARARRAETYLAAGLPNGGEWHTAVAVPHGALRRPAPEHGGPASRRLPSVPAAPPAQRRGHEAAEEWLPAPPPSPLGAAAAGGAAWCPPHGSGPPPLRSAAVLAAGLPRTPPPAGRRGSGGAGAASAGAAHTPRLRAPALSPQQGASDAAKCTARELRGLLAARRQAATPQPPPDPAPEDADHVTQIVARDGSAGGGGRRPRAATAAAPPRGPLLPPTAPAPQAPPLLLGLTPAERRAGGLHGQRRGAQAPMRA